MGNFKLNDRVFSFLDGIEGTVTKIISYGNLGTEYLVLLDDQQTYRFQENDLQLASHKHPHIRLVYSNDNSILGEQNG